MASKIVLPAVVIMLTMALVAAEKIKCYECIAVGGANDECDGEIMVKSKNHNPIECSTSSLYAWYRKVKDHSQLTVINDIFRVDVSPQKDLDVPMACLKMNLRVENQPVILRTCQTAKTEQVDTCKSIEKLIAKKYRDQAEVQNCTLCDTDSCNGSYGLSPTMTIAMLPLVGSILMRLVHGSA